MIPVGDILKAFAIVIAALFAWQFAIGVHEFIFELVNARRRRKD